MFKKLFPKKANGFTLLETLIVISAMGILVAMGAIAYRGYDKRVNLDVTAQKIINTLRTAQNQSITSKTSSQYGVHFDQATSVYYLFEGDTWANRDPVTLKTFEIPTAIEMYEANFAETNIDVVFRKLTGVTPNFGSLKIRVKSNHNQFRTISVNPEGKIGEYEFDEAVPPTSFSLNSPFAGHKETTTLTPAFDWEDSTGANITYTLWISKDPNFSTKDEITSILNSSYTLQAGEEIENHARNYWKVKAVNSAGIETWSNEGNWFMDVDVSNPPEDFSLLSPVNDYNETNTLTPTFDWEDATDPDGDPITYTLQHSNIADFSTKTEITLISDSQYSLKPSEKLTPDATNYWRVFAVDSNGAIKLCRESAWTIFTGINYAPNAFSLVSPGNNSVTNTLLPTFDWADATDPDSGDTITYTIWFSTDPTFTSRKEVSGLSTSTYTIPVKDFLLENTKYYWKVRAIDNHGAETWSNQQDWSFNTINYDDICVGTPENKMIFNGAMTLNNGNYFISNCIIKGDFKVNNSHVLLMDSVVVKKTEIKLDSDLIIYSTVFEEDCGTEACIEEPTFDFTGDFIVDHSKVVLLNMTLKKKGEFKNFSDIYVNNSTFAKESKVNKTKIVFEDSAIARKIEIKELSDAVISNTSTKDLIIEKSTGTVTNVNLIGQFEVKNTAVVDATNVNVGGKLKIEKATFNGTNIPISGDFEIKSDTSTVSITDFSIGGSFNVDNKNILSLTNGVVHDKMDLNEVTLTISGVVVEGEITDEKRDVVISDSTIHGKVELKESNFRISNSHVDSFVKIDKYSIYVVENYIGGDLLVKCGTTIVEERNNTIIGVKNLCY